MSTPTFAVSTHLYHDERLSRDHLVEISAHGFDAIELFANRPHLGYEDERMVAELEEAVADTGLRVHSIHAPIAPEVRGGRWAGAYSIASADEDARARAMGEAQAALAIARHIPVAYLVVHVGVPDSQHPAETDNRLDAARRSIESLHASAEPLGVRLALEVLPNRLSSAERLVRFIEDELEADGVGICLDFGHAHLMGDVVDAVETVAEHLATTHVHDNGGRTDDHLVPFEGGLPWNSALMAVLKVGFEGALVFELASSPTPRKTLEQARRARQRLEALLNSS